MDVANFIRDLRVGHGMSQNDLAQIAGVSISSVSCWELGKKLPRMGAINKMADYFGIPTAAFFGGELHNELPVPAQRMLPIYSDVSAGNGVLADNTITGYEHADAKYADGNHFYLRVKGDSMSPRIEDGDLVLVKRQDSVDSGSLGVFVVDGEEGLVKRVQYGEEYITLISVNPAYPPRTFVGSEVLRVRVVGKVVQLLAQFD